jgi:ABC-type transport system involved in multi-copper enzyme maturation permease subunit
LIAPVRARRHIGVLVRHDLRYSLSSPRGLLFLIFFALLWGWAFYQLAGGVAENLGKGETSFLIALVFDMKVLRLLQQRPPTLAAYFVVATLLTPLFAMLGSCDQTATDLGTRHIRFLIPRVGRAEIFIARLLGATMLVTCAQLLAGVGATIVTLIASSGDTGDIIAYGAQVTAILIVYSLPFIALMSFVSAAMASVGLALLVGLGGYVLLAIALSALLLKGAAATIVPLLLPSGLKPHFQQPDVGPALLGAAACLIYAAAYAVLGWQVFRKRDA